MSEPFGHILSHQSQPIRSIRLITKIIADACERGLESSKGFVAKSESSTPIIQKAKKDEVKTEQVVENIEEVKEEAKEVAENSSDDVEETELKTDEVESDAESIEAEEENKEEN